MRYFVRTFVFGGIHHSLYRNKPSVPLSVEQPQNIFLGGVSALSQYDNPGGVFRYFFVPSEIDVLEL